MFKEFDEDRVSAQNPITAAMDAQRRTAENKEKYFDAADAAIYDEAFAKVKNVWGLFGRNTYQIFNKSGFSIKVNTPTKSMVISKEIRDLERSLANTGVTFDTNKQNNRFYRFPEIS